MGSGRLDMQCLSRLVSHCSSPMKCFCALMHGCPRGCVVPAGLPEPLLGQLDMLSYREQLDAISTGCQSAVACRSDMPNLFSPSSLTGQPSCCAAPALNRSCLHDLHCKALVRGLSVWLPASRPPGIRNCFGSPCWAVQSTTKHRAVAHSPTAFCDGLAAAAEGDASVKVLQASVDLLSARCKRLQGLQQDPGLPGCLPMSCIPCLHCTPCPHQQAMGDIRLTSLTKLPCGRREPPAEVLGPFPAAKAINHQSDHPAPEPTATGRLTPSEQQIAQSLGGQCMVVLGGFWEYEVCWALEVR